MKTLRRKVAIVVGSPDMIRMFRRHGWKVVDRIADADLIQFTGGADVSPDMYGEETHPLTSTNPARDARETLIFQHGLKKGIPMAGICRGGQLLNVLCGGAMWQHVDRHTLTGTHIVTDMESGDSFWATSTHHQMMRPGQQGRIVLGAYESTMRERFSKGMKISYKREQHVPDVEAIHYPLQKVFCFQPHPEYRNMDALAKRYFNYIDTLLFKQSEKSLSA